MGESTKRRIPNAPLLQSKDLHEYILRTSVYAREPAPLKELRDATATQPRYYLAADPDVSQLVAKLLKLINAKKTIEIGVFTGYSLLTTALAIPNDGKITSIDVNRETYEIGLPFIRKAGVEHQINFIQSPALPILNELLQEEENEGSFDFAFVDADKINYWNYHEKLMKLVRPGGMLIYDNTLWGGTVCWPEEAVPEGKRESRKSVMEFNKLISADHRIELVLGSIGDGMTICRRIF
ncbi:hypothetical protein SLE2022_268430 [Rubroshorea leprosula]